jgi:AraC-like DNA-binding protein
MKNFYKYLSQSESDEKWGFFINTVGYTLTSPNNSYPNTKGHPSDHIFNWNNGRVLNGFYLVFITKGRGTFESAFTKATDIASGTCFFLFPGVWHRYRPDHTSGWEEYWVGFKGFYPNSLLKNNFLNPYQPVVNIGRHDAVLILFHKIIELVQKGAQGYNQIISGLVLEMLGIINSLILNDNQGDEAARTIAKAKFLMNNSISEVTSMESIVGELGISYSKFRKLFKEVTGEAPNQYYLNVRLSKARELLATTNLTVDQIAFQTGFDSIFYFSRIFKRKNGVSPRTFKKRFFNS